MERFWKKVDRRGEDECWPFTGHVRADGYGWFWLDGRNHYAHRVAYLLVVGPIPEGLTLDHVKARGCTRRDCCNPAHLEPVTMRENLLRGESLQAHNSRKTHCVNGHPFDAENTIQRTRPGGGRKCRACRDRSAT